MSVTAISGLGEKAAACFLVEIGGARFLLDLGKGPEPHPFPDLSGIGRIDAILISHGHDDHVGGLHLAQAIGAPPIYATATTRALADQPALRGARDLPVGVETLIAGVPILAGRAGHAAGGVWMRVGGEAGVLYSGDFSREGPLYAWETPRRAATLIADASYGTYDTPLSMGRDALLAEAAKGPLLLPLPPTGRGVEVAVEIHEAGLSLAICARHRRLAEIMAEAGEAALVPGGAGRIARMLAAAGALEADSPPSGVMIAANGMATGGLAAALFARYRNDPAVRILFTGHVDKDTPAAAAIAAGRCGFLRWNVHPRLSDLAWLLEAVAPRTTLLAFCGEARGRETREALGL
jgi:L-ascorbate metabolism protein UlaG (beta-lactamase superfamily)